MNDIYDLPVMTESEYLIWKIKRYFAHLRHLQRIRRVCRYKQIFLGLLIVMVPLFILYLLIYFQGRLIFALPTGWMFLWGIYLIGTRRNFFYEIWLDEAGVKN